MNGAPDITFFVPCLNEELNVLGTLNVILAAVNQVKVSYEIVVVDDASTDKTAEIVETFQREHPGVPLHLTRNAINQGLGHNYAAAAVASRGRHYMLVNGDNVEPVGVVTALLSRLGLADIIIPYFGRLDKRPLKRRIISRTFTILVNLLSGTSVRYYNGAVIHLRENVVKHHPGTRGFAYEAELITRLIARGATYLEVEVPGAERPQGVSTAFKMRNAVSVGGSLIRIGRARLFGRDKGKHLA